MEYQSTNTSITKEPIKEKVISSIYKFIEWQTKNGYHSYDQYDFWNSDYGIISKRLYYKNKYLGIPFVAPIFTAEIFFPYIRRQLASRKRFPIADAHFILGFTNLYVYTSSAGYLQKAKAVAEELLESSQKGYSGHCRGYQFDWMTTRGLWKRGIPLITTTAYCFEAFLRLFDLTKEYFYLNVAYSIFLFTLNDLKTTQITQDAHACSYSPIDNSQIINANAYRAFVLVEGCQVFGEMGALKNANLNINFILKSQGEDGSWLYSANDKRDHFVDNFHTCFVLKNLIKINRVLKDERISLAIKKGFNFYKWHLLGPDKSPLPFAKISRFNVVKKEMYDYAEGISLCLDMQMMDNEAAEIACKQVLDVITKYQKIDGSFITRTNIFNMQNRVPYLRWPQSQIFYALTNYLLKNKD